MKKIIFVLVFVLSIIGCEKGRTCKTCTTFVYYYNNPIEIHETELCDKQLEFWDGHYAVSIGLNGEIENFTVTVCE